MIVTTGQAIPFLLILEYGETNRYVLAHLTNAFGIEEAGSPFPLTYSGNRSVYAGTGPTMGIDLLEADYAVYLDSGYTQLDPNYLPVCASDWVEPSAQGATLNQYFGTPIVVTPQIQQVNVEVTTPIVAVKVENDSNHISVSEESTQVNVVEENINIGI